MINAAGTVVDTQSYANDASEYSVTFTPEASGEYTFSVRAIRRNETDKAGAETKTLSFTLPLVAPTITGAFNTMIVAIFGQDKEAQEKFKEQHDLQDTRVESATTHNAVIRNKSSDSSEE